MGKEAAAAAASSSSTVVLAVNGKRYEAAGVAPSMSLLEFLRTQTPVRGPKLGCGEASGEPPLLLAASVHCAMREAIRAARKEFSVSSGPANSTATFQMDVPATMPVVKELCGLDVVERYLESVSAAGAGPNSTKA